MSAPPSVAAPGSVAAAREALVAACEAMVDAGERRAAGEAGMTLRERDAAAAIRQCLDDLDRARRA